MKYNLIWALVNIALLILFLPSASYADQYVSNEYIETKDYSKEVEFKKEKLIIMTLLKVRDRYKTRFKKEYLKEINFIAKDYEAEQLVTLNSYHIVVGDLRPDQVLFSHWPDLQHYRAFLEDSRVVALDTLKKEATRIYQIGIFSTAIDTKIKFHSNKVYEVFGAVVNPDNAHLLAVFLNTVLDVGINQYGRNQVLDLKSMKVPEASYTSDTFGIAEWPSPVNFFGFAESELFQNAVEKYRNPALDRLDMINTFVDVGG